MLGDSVVHAEDDAMQRRSGRGSKLSRSETVTVRLDPKLRYLADLAARKQRRTVSSFIEWAIEHALSRVPIQEWDEGATMISQVAEKLWDVDDSERFAKLALSYPEMLTHSEQVLWKLIREHGLLWRGHYNKSNRRWTWEINEHSLIFERLREHWDTFRKVASGEAERSMLPEWQQYQPVDKPAERRTDDDDIPF